MVGNWSQIGKLWSIFVKDSRLQICSKIVENSSVENGTATVPKTFEYI
jgi:hypothetical protein